MILVGPHWLSGDRALVAHIGGTHFSSWHSLRPHAPQGYLSQDPDHWISLATFAFFFLPVLAGDLYPGGVKIWKQPWLV